MSLLTAFAALSLSLSLSVPTEVYLSLARSPSHTEGDGQMVYVVNKCAIASITLLVARFCCLFVCLLV
uniref:Putative secreted protein n=1 Tax=Anopheles darlingi TaxID=43151 RepID=A0A2M4DN14_ANODA